MPPQSSARRGSEPFRFGDIPQSESDMFRQVHPSLLEYMRGINGYVPPPAMIQGLMAARADEAGESTSPIQPGIKSDMQTQPGFAWVDPPVVPSSSATPGGPVYQQFGGPGRQHPHNLDLGQENVTMAGGVYVPGGPADPGAVMAQAVGTFGYPAELNGDGTWQQLMVQLGVMDGQS
jgi:hypothetical protein